MNRFLLIFPIFQFITLKRLRFSSLYTKTHRDLDT